MISCIFLILSAVPTPKRAMAEIVDWGTDKDAYRIGDKATVRISIKNTGGSDIATVEVQASIEKEFLGSFIKLLSDRIYLPVDRIEPGKTEQYERTETIPNFPGRYRISVKVIADGLDVGEFQKTIAVAR